MKITYLKMMEQQSTHRLKTNPKFCSFTKAKFLGSEVEKPLSYLSSKIEVEKPLGHSQFKIEIEKPLNRPRLR